MTKLVIAHPPAELWRSGHRGRILTWPPIEFRGGGRFDAPNRNFGTLYAAEHPITCLIETLSRYRPAPAYWHRHGSEMVQSPLDINWLRDRVVVRFMLQTALTFVDLRAPASLTVLNRELCDVALALQIQEIDLSSLLESQHRLSREIAFWAYQNNFAGVVYPSRLGDLPPCWAIFEGRATLTALGDPDAPPDPGLLKEAADMLAIRLPEG